MTSLSPELLIQQANEALARSDFQHVRDLCAQVKLSSEVGSFEYCDALIIESIVEWSRGQNREALQLAKLALEHCEKHGQHRLRAKALGTLSLSYSALGELSSMIDVATQALHLYREQNNLRGVANASGNIGNAYYLIADYATALEYYQTALAIDEELQNKSGIARHLSNIGLLYNNLVQHAKAVEYFEKALAMSEELGQADGIAKNLSNLGAVYEQLGDYPSALENFRRALSMYTEINSPSGLGTNYCNLANICIKQKAYDDAEEYLNKAEAVFDSINYGLGLIGMLGVRGDMYAAGDNPNRDATKAEQSILRGLQLSEASGEKHATVRFHDSLAKLYMQEQRWEDCCRHLMLFQNLEREIVSDSVRTRADQFEQQRQMTVRERELAIERARAQATQDLLHNTLPPVIADRLLNNEKLIADHYEAVSVLFMDIVNFTPIAQRIPPKHLIHVLNNIFSRADAVMKNYGLEKIKTIGDAYMAVAGAPHACADHALRTAQAACELAREMRNLEISIPDDLGDSSWIHSAPTLSVRIGLHCGEAVGGVIGEHKYVFDLWGDAINTAARMESHGEAGMIHVSEDFKNEVERELAAQEKQTQWTPRFQSRGEFEIKGKGLMQTYFLIA